MTMTPFTPSSPGWEKGVRLDACPSWCDGSHALMVNDEWDTAGRLIGADAMHTSAGVTIRDETADVLGDGAILSLEAYPDGEGGPTLAFVVVDDVRMTPTSARAAAVELLRLTEELEAL